MRQVWPEHVTAWNRDGIAWRQMSAVELLWLVHVQKFDALRRTAKTRVRQYLMATRDFDRLAAWDAGSFNETDLEEAGADD